MDKLLVISDLHLSPSGPLNSFHQGPQLAAFVQAHASSGTTLVIAGDGLDLLQIEPRPATLDMSRAPELIERGLAALAAEPWGRDLFAALATHLTRGGRLVILPGNHDPELHDPSTKPLILRALGLSESHPGLEVHTSETPYRVEIGRWRALVGHGHRSDPWNDIDPGAIRRAVAAADASLPLPPGSRLVLHVINRFKRARDPGTGAPRFPFIDLLKPEKPAVPYLLLYIDPALALEGLREAFGPIASAVLRGARRRLQGGPTLAPEEAEEALDPIEALGEGLVEGFDEVERRSPARCVLALEEMLEAADGAVEGTLATHGGRRWLLRAALRRASLDGTFFEPAIAGEDDRPIIDEHLANAEGATVVIAGHTHAARDIRNGERVYLNTGTWSDLMRLPRLDDEEAVKRFVDELEAGRIARVRRPTYAEVTEAGPRLLEWTEAGGVPVKPIRV